MKFIYITFISASLFLASNVYAIPHSDVIDDDILIGQTNWTGWNSPSFDTFLSSFGYSSSNFTEIANSDGDSGNWLEVTGEPASEDWYAWDFAGLNPDVFFVKTGNNVSLASDPTIKYDVYLFDNIGSLQYGTIDLNIFDRTNNGSVTVGILSHIRSINAEVPEPSILILLGSYMVRPVLQDKDSVKE